MSQSNVKPKQASEESVVKGIFKTGLAGRGDSVVRKMFLTQGPYCLLLL